MEPYGTVLLVEDDLALAAWIADYLQSKGFNVVHFARGDEALQQWQTAGADVILLDLMLPGVNGLEICRHIRQQSDIPVLMLTAQGEELDEVLALESGANDYLVKPVRPRALLARLNSILRQHQKYQQQSPLQAERLQFGKLLLDYSSRRVNLADEEINLSATEFKLLWFLARQAGVVLGRQDVFREMTGRDYDGLDRRVDMLISVLRRKLGDNSSQPQRIKTVWGEGYLFVADAWA
ncbi:response regulator transcription factor [Cellvibrio polysaccharolyticus]|uniref:DNA-binding response regulator n=1 Tax=Cellvibrio polysaccharolyticus TaxID=2082724 RepID=A0A928V5S4_9GAMM|nr:response regulator transcription factor [Cellvibrio polysaccharolyticus]MBE8717710.1 DNA-binding response regulator [Cellvibrio polysaccharolyticus]